jgi:membrane protein YqaA with SNARE-associated domain
VSSQKAAWLTQMAREGALSYFGSAMVANCFLPFNPPFFRAGMAAAKPAFDKYKLYHNGQERNRVVSIV